MHCPVYSCNRLTVTAKWRMKCFFRFPSRKSSNQQYRKKAWVEFCKRKAFNRSSNTRMFSRHYTFLLLFILFFFPLLLAHIRMLALLLDSRVNIFNNNDLKPTISLQNVRYLDRHRRKYIACFYAIYYVIRVMWHQDDFSKTRAKMAAKKWISSQITCK